MAIQKLTTAANRAYAETIKSKQTTDIDQVLFPTLDIALGAEIAVDEYKHGASVMRTITQGQASNTRVIEAGTHTTFTPPIHSEKVLIDSALRDQAVAGVDPTRWQQTVQTRVDRILNGPDGFVESWKMARRKAALTLLETGAFKIYNTEAKTETEINFKRTAANSFTYNLSSSGNDFDDAIKKAVEQTRKAYAPTGGVALLLGSKWLTQFDTDSKVIKKREAQQSLELLQLNMQPPQLKGVEGLNVIARYRVDGLSMPVWILTYEPPQMFKTASSGTPAPYVADDKMLLFNLQSGGWRFYRGLDVLDAAGNIERVQQGLAIDSFTEKDPIAEVLRAQSRFAYMFQEIDHTACVTGSNFT